MLKRILKVSLLTSLLLTSELSLAGLPLDMSGEFGFGSIFMDNYRRIKETTNNSSSNGSQEVDLANGQHANASFQTYLFKLNPTIIINDAATFKSEISTGYGRGGRFGDSTKQNKEGNFGNALYLQNTSSDANELVLNQFFVELYADTATYIVGRHSNHWGLGAVVNDGESTWDRHASIRDGVTLKLKIGNFFISPFWAKLSSSNSLTRATKAKEIGASFLYDNIERDISFGLLYLIKENNEFEANYTSNVSDTGSTSLGAADVKMTNLFFKKTLGKLDLALEIPIITGEIGNVYGAGSTKYKTKAFIFETDYDLTTSWNLGLDFGKVNGDSGNRSSFQAMFLHPNYQVANLLFRYNMRAISNPNSVDVHDSYITNAWYYKFGATYTNEKWTWDMAFIFAKADEVAKTGEDAYNHSTNKIFTANANQADDYGSEVDVGVTYHWNNEIKIGSSIGYLLTGDYYAFTNSTTKNTAKDTYILNINTSIDF